MYENFSWGTSNKAEPQNQHVMHVSDSPNPFFLDCVVRYLSPLQPLPGFIFHTSSAHGIPKTDCDCGRLKVGRKCHPDGAEVWALHVLIKHQGSRRKASWKDPEGTVIMNTTRESAASQLKALRDDIVSGKAKFDDVAFQFSDSSSAKRGGDLGPFGRGQMQKPFEEATYALKVGEISDIFDTHSGLHIIMRTVECYTMCRLL